MDMIQFLTVPEHGPVSAQQADLAYRYLRTLCEHDGAKLWIDDQGVQVTVGLELASGWSLLSSAETAPDAVYNLFAKMLLEYDGPIRGTPR